MYTKKTYTKDARDLCIKKQAYAKPAISCLSIQISNVICTSTIATGTETFDDETNFNW